ncbi:MAG: hypothetical protein ACOXZR_02130 [Bacilli bacterium]|jgi:hypothetical protein
MNLNNELKDLQDNGYIKDYHLQEETAYLESKGAFWKLKKDNPYYNLKLINGTQLKMIEEKAIHYQKEHNYHYLDIKKEKEKGIKNIKYSFLSLGLMALSLSSNSSLLTAGSLSLSFSLFYKGNYLLEKAKELQLKNDRLMEIRGFNKDLNDSIDELRLHHLKEVLKFVKLYSETKDFTACEVLFLHQLIAKEGLLITLEEKTKKK